MNVSGTIIAALSVCTFTCFPFGATAQYKGTGSVTQGPATTTTTNLYTCPGGRQAGIGTIKATDNTQWTVPALVNFTNTAFPFASDLHNSCTGKTYANSSAALAALDGTDIITIDADGELITAFVFADNYFEMYVNGVPVGKDNVPFTQFNSNLIRFRVKRPFTVAVLLVDWEENLGLGSELNGGFAYHPGDGGMVAVFKDSKNTIIAKTDQTWKAQTFYTSPVTDLSCPTETGTKRLSNLCSTANSQDGTKYYGLHWSRPANWMNAGFDDSQWPDAVTYTNATIGVDNKPAYTNFTDIFDSPGQDADFIWSSNVILDNEVIVRKTISAQASSKPIETGWNAPGIVPNPANTSFRLAGNDLSGIVKLELINSAGMVVRATDQPSTEVQIRDLPSGLYRILIYYPDKLACQSLMVK